ncbi:MFS transporter [Streptomyces sp. NBC_01216]|uniref:MFS transporter n=1 Tax=Streptomyces sp. NBC_01216 TaxID=2903778 RepID=UPI003FA374AB
MPSRDSPHRRSPRPSLAPALARFPSEPGRGEALGIWGAVTGAGGAGGVLLGGALTQTWGWPWIFHSVALGSVLVLAFVSAAVPPGAGRGAGRAAGRAAGRTVGRTVGRFDLTGTITVTLAPTCLVGCLATARKSGWTEAECWAP